MESTHQFTSGKAKLSAVWHETLRRDSPLVIFHHGFGGTKVEAHRIFVKCARQLAEKGIESFRFDFYGSGDSDGNLTDATFSLWIENALEAASYVRFKGKKKIILHGFSLGAFVAAAAAARIQPLGLTLWAPIFHPLRRILREKAMVKEARRSGFADYRGEVVNYRLVEDSERFKIPEIFKGYSGPVCLIRGTEDASALLSESRQFADLYRSGGSQVEMHAIQDANHSFDRHEWEEEVIAHTLRWVMATTNEK